MKFLQAIRGRAGALLSLILLFNGINLVAADTVIATATNSVGTAFSHVGSAAYSFANECAQATGRIAFAAGAAAASGIGTCTVAGLEAIRPRANIVEWLYGAGDLVKEHKIAAITTGALAVTLAGYYHLNRSMKYGVFVQNLYNSLDNKDRTTAEKVLKEAPKFVGDTTVALLHRLYHAMHCTSVGENIEEMKEDAHKSVMGPWWWSPYLMLRTWSLNKKYEWDVNSPQHTTLMTTLGTPVAVHETKTIIKTTS